MTIELCLGKDLDASVKVQRDSIHVPIMQVVAGELLKPGEHIGLRDGKAYKTDVKLLGNVDPVRTTCAIAGSRFWMWVYPGSIDSLTHTWTHQFIDSDISNSPLAIQNATAKIQAEAAALGMTYDELVEGATEYMRSGEYMCQGGRFEGCYLSDDFWPAFFAVFPEEAKEGRYLGSFFSCSC